MNIEEQIKKIQNENIDDLADYLISSSDDIWETLHFFDEINFNNLIASNYGDVNE